MYYYGTFAHKDPSAYDEPWFRAQRMRGARLTRRYLRPTAETLETARGEWAAMLGNATVPVLGIHVRGTDVEHDTSTGFSRRRRVDLSEYLPLAEEYVQARPSARVFIATDDVAVLERVSREWAQLAPRVVARARQTRVVVGAGCIHRVGGGEAAGRDVLIDILLLARCARPLHAEQRPRDRRLDCRLRGRRGTGRGTAGCAVWNTAPRNRRGTWNHTGPQVRLLAARRLRRERARHLL